MQARGTEPISRSSQVAGSKQLISSPWFGVDALSQQIHTLSLHDAQEVQYDGGEDSVTTSVVKRIHEDEIEMSRGAIRDVVLARPGRTHRTEARLELLGLSQDVFGNQTYL